MRRSFTSQSLTTLAFCLLAAGGVNAASPNGVNATFGTTGLGVEVSRQLSEKLRVRGILSVLSVPFDGVQDNIDYNIDLGLTNFGAVLDLHPAANPFRLSFGLVATNPSLDMTSVSTQTNYQVGNNTYSGDVSIDGSADFNSMAPYLGIGWSSNLNSTGVYFSGDLGFMYLGDPKITVNAAGVNVRDQNGNSINLTSSTQFQDDLEQERSALEDDLSGFNIWPLLVFGVGYRF